MTEDTLYIVAGPVYLSVPELVEGKTIGNNHKVDVPTGFFKVILSLHKGHEKAIWSLSLSKGFYSNTALKQPLSSTAHSVNEIEELTGIDFFKELDDQLEERLESQYRISDW